MFQGNCSPQLNYSLPSKESCQWKMLALANLSCQNYRWKFRDDTNKLIKCSISLLLVERLARPHSAHLYILAHRPDNLQNTLDIYVMHLVIWEYFATQHSSFLHSTSVSGIIWQDKPAQHQSPLNYRCSSRRSQSRQ